MDASERVQSERTREERVRVGSAGRTVNKDGKSTRPEKDEVVEGGRGGGETLLTPPSIQDGVGSGSPRH